MTCVTEDDIRLLAFQLWQAAGQPDGEMDRFWYQAEKELIRRGYSSGSPSDGDESIASLAAE
jgi:hypothetical protein